MVLRKGAAVRLGLGLVCEGMACPQTRTSDAFSLQYGALFFYVQIGGKLNCQAIDSGILAQMNKNSGSLK